MLSRLAVGALLALAVATLARRARALSGSGAAAAFVAGTLSVGAGWHFAAVLLLFFVTSTLLSRWRASAKAEGTAGMVEKGHERDAMQVVANGGIFALAAMLAALMPASAWTAAALGALATSTADTWSTEVGIAVGGTPRAITTFRRVPRGLSGGVTLAGTAASIAGSATIAIGSALLGLPWNHAVAVAVGGVAGSMADSILGDTLQERRRCDGCGAATERSIHTCGAATSRVGGLGGFGNDAVNLTSSMLGAGVAATLAAGLRA